MTWNKRIALLLVLLLLLSTLSCSAPIETQEGTQDAAIDKTPVKIEYQTDFEAVEQNAFGNLAQTPASDFDRVTQNGTVTITGYRGTAAAVRVPERIDGSPVTSIGAGAFANNKSLKTLFIPDSVTHIGTSILSGCSSLEHLRTPLLGADSTQVQRLGYLFGVSDYVNHARDIPATLILLSVGGGVRTLSDYALYDCNDLQYVILPTALGEVGKFAFYNCAALEKLVGLDQVREVGEYAFADCAKLCELSFGKPLESVGFGAFFGCRRLTALTLPFAGGSRTEHTYLGYVFGAEYPDFAKGYYPPALARVELLEGCTALGDYAFYECKTLKEIILPNGLRSVGVRAFYGCEVLWSVVLPDTVKTIRENAFYGCDSLVSLTLGKGLETIGINAFYRCDSLTSVVLPATLSALPASCFADCAALESVDFGGVSEVGAQAFRGCRALKTVKTNHALSLGNGNEILAELLK